MGAAKLKVQQRTFVSSSSIAISSNCQQLQLSSVADIGNKQHGRIHGSQELPGK